MELNRPFATVTPTLDGDVLAVLAAHDVTFTTGQIHRVLNSFSEEGIRKVLARLVSQGVVLSERIGNAFAYRLNTAHLAAEPILELARLFDTFLKRLEEELGGWQYPPVYAAVFGSAVRGAMTPESDVDLFLVSATGTPDALWARQVNELATAVTAWTGNDARVVEYTEIDLKSARTEPMVQDLLERGLTVAGSRAWLLKQVKPVRAGKGVIDE
ncbi:nucleotidyltransferase domain-containing protein [Mycobacterium sp. CVI_P3]|uniref:Nucleotidyltransferase domain-containing protein n=1 Tax=Mycobacterium pinniadriaticum TaxID=2994102 RepID=A0ABT3SG72_9MYCO|nr:nucleotidyltransferase domain-containing protein [Mycobacterium pinniadriaticum]MCX2931458.1 nucleotidyltransferase domain-containing protein [Mycobacterium pinniadriaticum]MCX2937882.1 nucleotidyltransferase domain-containing protein [Mycobacterium pinniadriaticum]